MNEGGCTWKKVNGRYQCMAKKCPHWLEGGICQIGKVTLSCDNEECIFNSKVAPIYGCIAMDVHLDNLGHCLGVKEK